MGWPTSQRSSCSCTSGVRTCPGSDHPEALDRGLDDPAQHPPADRYEEQLALAAPGLILPRRSQEALTAYLRATLLHPDSDESGVVPRIVDALPDRQIEVNPFSLRDDPLPLSVEERTRRLDQLLG